MAHAHRWGTILGSLCALLLVTGPAWSLPTHDYDMGWGKDHDKSGDLGKHDKYGKLASHYYKSKDYELDESWWGTLEKHKDYDWYASIKWEKGHGKYDPDCDPPVATPEPATLLLLGSTLAGIGVYARRDRQPAGGSAQQVD